MAIEMAKKLLIRLPKVGRIVRRDISEAAIETNKLVFFSFEILL